MLTGKIRYRAEDHPLHSEVFMEEHKDDSPEAADAPEAAGAPGIAKTSETAGALKAAKAPEADNSGGLTPLAGMEKQLSELDKLARRLENSGVAEYVKLQKKTGKILFLNFLSGVARGLGFTVGTTIVLTILYQIISRIISMNIPYLTERLQEFLELTRGGQ